MGKKRGSATAKGSNKQPQKKSGGVLPFILARGIGQAFVDKGVDLAEVEAFLDQ